MAAALQKLTIQVVNVKRNTNNSMISCQISGGSLLEQLDKLLTQLIPGIRAELKRLLNQFTTPTIDFKLIVSTRQYQCIIANQLGEENIKLICQRICHKLDHDCYDILEGNKKQVKVKIGFDSSQSNDCVSLVFGSVFMPNDKDIAILKLQLLNCLNLPAINLYHRQHKLTLDASSLSLGILKSHFCFLNEAPWLTNYYSDLQKDTAPVIELNTENLAYRFEPNNQILTLNNPSSPENKTQILMQPLVQGLQLQTSQHCYELSCNFKAPEISELTISPNIEINLDKLTDINKMASQLLQRSDQGYPKSKDAARHENIANPMTFQFHSFWLPRLLKPHEVITLYFGKDGLFSAKSKAFVRMILSQQKVNIHWRNKLHQSFEPLKHQDNLQSILNANNIPLRVLIANETMAPHYHFGLKIKNHCVYQLAKQSLFGRDMLPDNLTHGDSVLCDGQKELCVSRYFFSRKHLKIDKLNESKNMTITHLSSQLRTFVVKAPGKVTELRQPSSFVETFPNTPVICGIYGFTFNSTCGVGN